MNWCESKQKILKISHKPYEEGDQVVHQEELLMEVRELPLLNKGIKKETT
jgi:hypothetical protein